MTIDFANRVIKEKRVNGRFYIYKAIVENGRYSIYRLTKTLLENKPHLIDIEKHKDKWVKVY